MQEYWQSNLDAGGSLFKSSTAYRILDHMDNRYKVDFEKENRFYKNRLVTEAPHKYSFMVVRKSMQTRYFFEMGVFFCIVIAFQYFLV
jgi:hypothetical protein